MAAPGYGGPELDKNASEVFRLPFRHRPYLRYTNLVIYYYYYYYYY